MPPTPGNAIICRSLDCFPQNQTAVMPSAVAVEYLRFCILVQTAGAARCENPGIICPEPQRLCGVCFGLEVFLGQSLNGY